MTDKEIATYLAISRDLWAQLAIEDVDRGDYWGAKQAAKTSVNLIHHIINSINWED